MPAPAKAKTAPAAPDGHLDPGAPKIISIPVSELYRDPLVNPRDPGEPWIAARSGPAYSRAKLGVLQVSLRDGSDDRKHGYAVIDGWNRRMLILKNEGPQTMAECEVFTGLSLAQEAGMFLGLNDSRRVHAVPRFLAQVTAQELIPVQVAGITRAAGFTIAEQRGAGTLTCVAMLVRIHARDKQKCANVRKPQALLRTLTCIETAYRVQDPAFFKRNEAGTHVSVVGGVGHLFLNWGDAADITRLERILAEWQGSANGLLQAANGAQRTVPGLQTADKAVAYLAARAYNKGLSSSSLPVPFNK